MRPCSGSSIADRRRPRQARVGLHAALRRLLHRERAVRQVEHEALLRPGILVELYFQMPSRSTVAEEKEGAVRSSMASAPLTRIFHTFAHGARPAGTHASALNSPSFLMVQPASAARILGIGLRTVEISAAVSLPPQHRIGLCWPSSVVFAGAVKVRVLSWRPATTGWPGSRPQSLRWTRMIRSRSSRSSRCSAQLVSTLISTLSKRETIRSSIRSTAPVVKATCAAVTGAKSTEDC